MRGMRKIMACHFPPHVLHAIDYNAVVGGIDGGPVLLEVFRVGIVMAVYFLHNVRGDVVPAVGHGSGFVAHLQRGNSQLALPDAKRDGGERLPAVAAIDLVVVLGGWKKSGALATKIHAQPAATPKAGNVPVKL